MDNPFKAIIQLIKYSRNNAIKAVNAELITFYWSIGEHICKKLKKSEWDDSVVTELAKYIQQNKPELKGFSELSIALRETNLDLASPRWGKFATRTSTRLS